MKSRFPLFLSCLLPMVLLLPCGAAEVHYVGVGEGSLILEVENDGDSAVPLENVTVNLSGNPSYFEAPASVSSVDPIIKGQVKEFSFPYTITSAAPDGASFTIKLTVVPQGTPNSVADDGSLDTLVELTTPAGQFLVENALAHL